LKKLKIKEMIKLYNPEEKNSLQMQFGKLVQDVKKTYVYSKRIDKRTKHFGNQRKHDGIMGKYK
tara:strand:+ start:509 stop:700 length:192 start_codon:yes stop_codon:yes gene_type:complete